MFWHLIILVHIAIDVVLSGVVKSVIPLRNSSVTLGDIFSRAKRQTGCRRDEWQCRDGSCIQFFLKCDGGVDCPDRSDEAHALCRNIQCQDNLFRCAYGACVDGTAPCNGVQECADNSDELQPKCRNATRVFKGQFKCDNGQEISAVELCDGEPNCQDGSDEKIEVCADNTCPSYLFQCAYGACVDGDSNCNGRQECADGSDEADDLCNRTSTAVVTFPPLAVTPPTTVTLSPALTTTLPTSFSPTCLLPPHPANGRYVVKENLSARPGQPFENVVEISVTCYQGYAVDGKETEFLPCHPNIDLQSMVPKCKQYCVLPRHHSVDYYCELSNFKGRYCTDKEFVGVKVVPKCKTPQYRGSPSYMSCKEGRWDHIATCTAECGVKSPAGKLLIIGGNQVRRGEIPWHAGIYDKTLNYKQICGGSLVTPTEVITAAHCFWYGGELRPPKDYAVALGKVYRVWDNNDDETLMQTSNVINIAAPEAFHGLLSHVQADIAIVKLETEIQFTPFIHPVCVDISNDIFNSQQLYPGNYGTIAGWGLTSAKGGPSDVLKVVQMPYVPHGECYKDSPRDFQSYITVDKICAGFTNGTALCEGDSGGGLAFPDPKDDDTEFNNIQRYYLRGIVSASPANDQLKCDPNQRTTFTAVFHYANFIREHVIL